MVLCLEMGKHKGRSSLRLFICFLAAVAAAAAAERFTFTAAKKREMKRIMFSVWKQKDITFKNVDLRVCCRRKGQSFYA